MLALAVHYLAVEAGRWQVEAGRVEERKWREPEVEVADVVSSKQEQTVHSPPSTPTKDCAFPHDIPLLTGLGFSCISRYRISIARKGLF